MTTVKEVAEQQEKQQHNLIHRTLDKTKSLLKNFLIADEDVYIVVSVWIAHTYIWLHLEFTPYLNVWSAQSQCGKSRLIEILEWLCKNAFKADAITNSSLVRTIHADKPTMLWDEVDAVMGKGKPTPEQKETTALLNSGYRQGGLMIKSRPTDKGFVVEKLNTFCPKCFGSIGADSFQEATRSRYIHIRMYAKKYDGTEEVEKNTRQTRAKYKGRIDEIKDGLEEWAKDTLCYEDIVDMPEQLSDRNTDIYIPLFQIANEAGADWFKALTESAIHLSGRKDNAIETSTQLLIDTHAIITDNNFPDDHLMYSTWYIDALCEFDESPWSTYTRGGQISSRAIAGILRSYGIKPQRDNSGRGYVVGDFLEVIERHAKAYLPPAESVTSVTANRNEVTDVTVNSGGTSDYDSFRRNPHD